MAAGHLAPHPRVANLRLTPATQLHNDAQEDIFSGPKSSTRAQTQTHNYQRTSETEQEVGDCGFEFLVQGGHTLL